LINKSVIEKDINVDIQMYKEKPINPKDELNPIEALFCNKLYWHKYTKDHQRFHDVEEDLAEKINQTEKICS
jgi:hypothetical protein